MAAVVVVTVVVVVLVVVFEKTSNKNLQIFLSQKRWPRIFHTLTTHNEVFWWPTHKKKKIVQKIKHPRHRISSTPKSNTAPAQNNIHFPKRMFIERPKLVIISRHNVSCPQTCFTSFQHFYLPANTLLQRLYRSTNITDMPKSVSFPSNMFLTIPKHFLRTWRLAWGVMAMLNASMCPAGKFLDTQWSFFVDTRNTARECVCVCVYSFIINGIWAELVLFTFIQLTIKLKDVICLCPLLSQELSRHPIQTHCLHYFQLFHHHFCYLLLIILCLLTCTMIHRLFLPSKQWLQSKVC